MIFSHNIVIFPIFNGDLSCFKWDFCDNVGFFFKFVASIWYVWDRKNIEQRCKLLVDFCHMKGEYETSRIYSHKKRHCFSISYDCHIEHSFNY